jgi:CRISPR-associated protein Csd2
MDKIIEKIKAKPYCAPNRRMDFVLFFDVRDGNPNGDPDAGNLPRVDPQSRHGIVTDVCIKRKIRDYLCSVLGRPIYIQSQVALNTLYFEAARKVQEVNENATNEQKEASKAVEALLVEIKACDNIEFKNLIASPEANNEDSSSKEKLSSFRDWLSSIDVDGLDFDIDNETIRFLGEAKSEKEFKELLTGDEQKSEFDTQINALAKLLAKAKKQLKTGAKGREAREAIKEKMYELYDDIRLFGAVLTAGTNAGQIRGPMQLTFARSIEQVLPLDAAITRCAITKASDWLKKQTEFGRKPWLNYAAYRQHGFYNAMLGKGTKVTSDDLARFWIAVANMFQEAKSASNGEMATQELIVFVHPNERGNAPSHRLLGQVKHKNNSELAQNSTTLAWPYEVNVDNEDKLKEHKIEVCKPLQDIWDGF